jgi:hypothetical protein
MLRPRLAIVAGIGVTALCGLAVAAALSDYVSHPEIANAHVPPVAGTPAPTGGPSLAVAATPAPITTSVAVPPSPAPPVSREQAALRILQPLQQQQRRRRVPRR